MRRSTIGWTTFAWAALFAVYFLIGGLLFSVLPRRTASRPVAR